MPVPKQKRGESKQDYETPPEFFEALNNRFGNFTLDLAATAENTKCVNFIGEEENSLTCNWKEHIGKGQAWLNPPFSNITPWVRKCSEFLKFSTQGKIFLLTPASVGSNWFADYVYKYAYVIALQGRLTFVGQKDPYPKDCILSIFHAGITGFEVWPWTLDCD